MAFQFAFGPNGAFFINSPQGAKAYSSANCPAPLQGVLGGQYPDTVLKVWRITFSSLNECAAVYENGQGGLQFGIWNDGTVLANTFGLVSGWVSRDGFDLKTLRLACGTDNSLVAVSNWGRQSQGIQLDLDAYLRSNEQNLRIQEVILGYGGAWVVIWGNGNFDYQLAGQYPALEPVLSELRQQMVAGAIAYLSLNAFAPQQYVLILASTQKPNYQVPAGWNGLVDEFAKQWQRELQERKASNISPVAAAALMPAMNRTQSIQRKPVPGSANPASSGSTTSSGPTMFQPSYALPFQQSGTPDSRILDIQRANTVAAPQVQQSISQAQASVMTPISQPQTQPLYAANSQGITASSAINYPANYARQPSINRKNIMQNVNSLVKQATPVAKKLANTAKKAVDSINKPVRQQYQPQPSQYQSLQSQQQQMLHNLQHQLHHQQQQIQQQQQQQLQNQYPQQNQQSGGQQQGSYFDTTTFQFSQVQQPQGFAPDPSQSLQGPSQTSPPVSILTPSVFPSPISPDQSALLAPQPQPQVQTASFFDASSTTVTDQFDNNGNVTGVDVITTQVDVFSWTDPGTGAVDQDVVVQNVDVDVSSVDVGGYDDSSGDW